MEGKAGVICPLIGNCITNFLDKTLGGKEYKIIPLAGDASVRSYYRIVIGNKSWVLMKWEPFEEDNYPFLSIQKHFEDCNISVPKVKNIVPDLGLVLLEDLGDLTLERKFWEIQHQEHIVPFYKQAIDELLKIHFKVTRDKDSHCTAFSIIFDAEKLLWEMNYGREHLFEKIGGIELSNQDLKRLQEIFIKICQCLDFEEKFICHRDYHSRNLMIHLGKMRVIDFQDARMGPVQYDLVSLMYDSYVDLNTESRREILNYYLACAEENFGYKVDRNHFDEVFTFQVIQRCFKACGSFSSFYNNRKDTRYLKYIRPTLETVVQYLEFFPEFKLFASIITDRGLLSKDYEAL